MGPQVVSQRPNGKLGSRTASHSSVIRALWDSSPHAQQLGWNRASNNLLSTACAVHAFSMLYLAILVVYVSRISFKHFQVLHSVKDNIFIIKSYGRFRGISFSSLWVVWYMFLTVDIPIHRLLKHVVNRFSIQSNILHCPTRLCCPKHRWNQMD